MPPLRIADRLAGAVWGHLIGDAVGVPYEFMAASTITSVEMRGGGSHGQLAGTWSDDGALMLAALDSLSRGHHVGAARFDTTDQAQRFVAWYDDGAFTPDGEGRFDVGVTTAAAISRFKAGASAESAGGVDEQSQGNGSLMRILPIPLYERSVADAVLVDYAHRSSAITHGHPVPQAACALYVLVARRLLAGASRKAALDDARGVVRHIYSGSSDAGIRLAALDELEKWQGRSGSGYVVDSFWTAWDALAGAADYRDTVVRAIRAGDDTDTTAAIAGGLAGLRWGIGGIRLEWRAGLRDHALVEGYVELLTADATQTRWQRPETAPPDSRTSENNPILVDRVDAEAVPAAAGWNGRLGMTFLPGKRDLGSAGRHWRDLEADVIRLRDYWSLSTLVLLVEDHELVATETTAIGEAMAESGIELIRYPIVDVSVPSDRASFRMLMSDLISRLRSGQRVAIACRGGIGRTGTVTACLLRQAGLDADAAVHLTRKTRTGTIETDEQEAFVHGWAVSDHRSDAD